MNGEEDVNSRSFQLSVLSSKNARERHRSAGVFLCPHTK
jgi:hypothetical protein